MNSRRVLLPLAGLAAVAGLAWASQVVFRPSDNVLAHRLAGTWVLDTAMTRKLDPDRTTASMKTLTFVDDASVIADMRGLSDRFKTRTIFGSGYLTIDEEKVTHPYIVTDMNGNPQIIWFTPTTREPFADPVIKNVWVGVARTRTNDLLLFGGDTVRDASSAFCRSTP